VSGTPGENAEKTFQYTAGEARGRHLNLLYVPTEGEEFQEAQLLAQDGEVLSDVEEVRTVEYLAENRMVEVEDDQCPQD
jgi:hypothetical protein